MVKNQGVKKYMLKSQGVKKYVLKIMCLKNWIESDFQTKTWTIVYFWSPFVSIWYDFLDLMFCKSLKPADIRISWNHSNFQDFLVTSKVYFDPDIFIN